VWEEEEKVGVVSECNREENDGSGDDKVDSSGRGISAL